MNQYFKSNDTIYELTQAYPETIAILVSNGFENMQNAAMRKSLGKTITLEQALTMKKMDINSFEERLVEAINQSKSETDSALLEKNKKQNARVSIQGVLPCPIRIPLLEGFEKWLLEQEDAVKADLDYQLQAASMGVEWMKDQVKASDSEDILADLFISAGFDLFFDKELIGKFKEQGIFKDLTGIRQYHTDFENERIQLRDPKGQYSMLAVVAAVFLVNTDELGNRAVPVSWEDLLKPEFENSVSLPIGDFDLFNAILLNIYKKYGEDGIRKLGRSLLQSMHPAEMVKSHIKKANKPAVTIMPYFFTKMTKKGGPMKAVWPKDGAIISPIFMLSKDASSEKIKPFVDFFASKEIGEILSHQGLFPSVHPEVDNLMEKENQYMWLGWDYIESHDIGPMIKELEEIFHTSKED